MASDKEIQKIITNASLHTPDPKKAETNLHRLTEAASDMKRLLPYLDIIAKLFAFSRFLANYCISNPDELLRALKEIKEPVTKKSLLARSAAELSFDSDMDLATILRTIRIFKKRYLLRITLRDITGITDTLTSMDELTRLAEIVIEFALHCSLNINSRKFGSPPQDSEFAIISFGKLGGEELNYSSDIDLMAVYDGEEGQTAGIVSPSGMRINRLSSSEFHLKVMELLTMILSRNTEDGVAYRVDLRLRPQGEKGEIALPLTSYRTYYETWGRTWERMALIRTRPVAGSERLGRLFTDTIESFVWKKNMDYSDIEEIKGLKKKIDSAFSKDDIKRGYGGIREVEFFIQTFQLIYGNEHASLRTHRLLHAIQSLRWLGLVPEEDLIALWNNYLCFRKIEHLLQMKDDLQTHSLPASDDDLNVLARQIGFPSRSGFSSDLKLRRMKVRNMYNSLLGTEDDVHAEALTLLEGDLNDDELAGYLSFRGLKTPMAALLDLKGIRDQFELFKTQRERALMRKVLPLLIERALDAESPERALKGLNNFFTALGARETYLTGLLERKELQEGIMKILSLSTYLTRIFLSNPRYLDLLLEGNVIRKTLRKTTEELQRSLSPAHFETSLAEYKNVEEIRLGTFFLMKVLRVSDLVRNLSHVAEAVIGTVLSASANGSRSLAHAPSIPKQDGLTVIGMGKLGSREITFGSDLDIIFLSKRTEDLKTAERVLKTLTAYTDRGIIYSIDMRLRPDGTKGTLVNDLEGCRNYYLKNAHPWELQSLLKSRPVAGNMNGARSFISMVKEVIIKKGPELKRDDIRSMRERIVRELSHESKGIDVKLGPGGIEEIEFHVQWLQLQHAAKMPDILVQDTLSAIHRLAKREVLSAAEAAELSDSYIFLRTIETFMRLNEEHVITEGSEAADLAMIFMGYKDKEGFLGYLEKLRGKVLNIVMS